MGDIVGALLPCKHPAAHAQHLDIKSESFFVDEMARGQWSIGIWSPYSNLIWKSLTYRSWTWWRHDMAAHHSLLAFCEGNFVVMTCGLPSQRSVIVTFHIFLCCQTCQTFQLPVIWEAMTPMSLVMERSAIVIAMDNYLDWIKFKCPLFSTISTFCLFSFLLQYLCGFIRFIFMWFFFALVYCHWDKVTVMLWNKRSLHNFCRFLLVAYESMTAFPALQPKHNI